MRPGRTKRRLLAILMLAETTGLRRHELTTRTWGHVRELALNAGTEGAATSGVEHYLSVVGKGGVARDVPLRESVIAALEEHLADRRALEDRHILSRLARADTPLLSAFRLRSSTDGSLSDATLHFILKRFFARVASDLGERTDLRGRSLSADFDRASCHWLRHTFAHQVLLVTGSNLPVAQQLLGHKSIATTGIYVKADMSERVAAIAVLPDQFR